MPTRASTPPRFPRLEEEVLGAGERATSSASRFAGARGSREVSTGASVAKRRPGSHHVPERGCSRTSSPAQEDVRVLGRTQGGWDCHGLPVSRGRESSSGSASRRTSALRHSPSSKQRCRSPCSSLEGGTADGADRLLDRYPKTPTGRRNDTSSGLVGAAARLGTAGPPRESLQVVPYCPETRRRCHRHEVSGLADVVDPSVYVKFPVLEPRGTCQKGDGAARVDDDAGTLVSNARSPCDPRSPTWGALAGDLCATEALVELGSARGRGARASHGRESRERAMSPRFPPFFFSMSGRGTGQGPHVLPPIVTPRTGPLVHTAMPSARTTSGGGGAGAQLGTRAPDDLRRSIGPYEGRFVKEADSGTSSRKCARAGDALRVEEYEHAIPNAGDDAHALLYYAKPPGHQHLAAARRAAGGNEPSTGTPTHQARALGKWRRTTFDWPSRGALLGYPDAGVAMRGGQRPCIGSTRDA